MPDRSIWETDWRTVSELVPPRMRVCLVARSGSTYHERHRAHYWSVMLAELRRDQSMPDVFVCYLTNEAYVTRLSEAEYIDALRSADGTWEFEVPGMLPAPVVKASRYGEVHPNAWLSEGRYLLTRINFERREVTMHGPRRPPKNPPPGFRKTTLTITVTLDVLTQIRQHVGHGTTPTRYTACVEKLNTLVLTFYDNPGLPYTSTVKFRQIQEGQNSYWQQLTLREGS